MMSAAVGRGGETMISAQTVEALWNAVEHVQPISIGLNCSLGPDLMYPFLSELAQQGERGRSPLPERRAAEPAVADRLRPRAARHGPLPRAVRGRGPAEHRRRLLREYARAHRGDRARPRGSAAPPRRRARPRSARVGGAARPRGAASAAAVGLAAVHAAAGRVHDDRRAHQRRRLAQVRQADQGREVRRGASRSRASRSRTAPTSSTSAWTRG